MPKEVKNPMPTKESNAYKRIQCLQKNPIQIRYNSHLVVQMIKQVSIYDDNSIVIMAKICSCSLCESIDHNKNKIDSEFDSN
jgi:hypothetical protein